jgi:hypothetical protein
VRVFCTLVNTCVPLRAFGPSHAPEATHEATSVEDHVTVIVAGAIELAGEAVRVTEGAA